MTANAILGPETTSISCTTMPSATMASTKMSSTMMPSRSKPRTGSLSADQQWQAVLEHDTAQDGAFVYAVKTTGVYCRPSCSSRRPLRKNVFFFAHTGAAEKAGFRPCLRCRPQAAPLRDARSTNVRAICRYIERHLEDPLSLNALGDAFDMSPFHLQRTFKAALGVSPKQYADSCRINLLKQNLQSGKTVTTALYDSGYSSSSRLYERAQDHLGMTPDKYRRGAIGVAIRYTTSESPIGRVLVAATDRGICAIRFGDSDSDLELALRREYPFAARKRNDDDLKGWSQRVLEHLKGNRLNQSLPLDIQATAFQRTVWEHLRTIPRGETKSYSEVARAIGRPTATRAVARACATNSVALEIPCHRVVREDGNLGGYRWGLERKKQLLGMEGAASN